MNLKASENQYCDAWHKVVDDHIDAPAYIEKIRTAQSPADKQKLAESAARAIRAQMHAEEKNLISLYTVGHNLFDASQLLEREHQEIDELFTDLLACSPSSAQFRHTLGILEDMLDMHMVGTIDFAANNPAPINSTSPQETMFNYAADVYQHIRTDGLSALSESANDNLNIADTAVPNVSHQASEYTSHSAWL